MGKGTGRGKGRGGCGDIIGETCDCIQGIAACICCLVCSGPILIIVGAFFLVSAASDDRGKRIDEYNVAVTTWANGGVDGWDKVPANAFAYTIKGGTGCPTLAQAASALKITTSPEDLGPEQGSGDLDSYTVAKFSADPNLAAGAQSACSVTLTVTYLNTTISTIQAPLSKVSVQSFSELGCTRSSSSSSNNRKEQTDFNRCASTCQSRGGEVSGSSTSSFQCTTQTALAGVGIRVTQSGGGYSEASGFLPGRDTSTGAATGKGIFIETPGSWSQTDYTRGSPAPLIEVRYEKDPYLYFLDITRGAKDFGLTTGEKLSIGFTCLVIGLVITLCMCGVCFCIVKFARKDKSSPDARPQNPVGGALYDVSAKYSNYIPGGQAIGYPAGPPPAGYPQQQHAPQQQQPYGQQQYSSGPPPQPYGGPPAPQPYGQPATGYPSPYPSRV